MKFNAVLLGFFIIIMGFLCYFVFFGTGDSPTGNVLLDNSGLSVEGSSETNTEAESMTGEDSVEQGSEGFAGGGAGGGGSSESESESGSGSEENYSEERSQIPMCMLVRPGNLPDIGCFVSSITSDEVSINLRNELGENIGVEISLSSCGPSPAKGNLTNEEIKNFVFACEGIEDYFNKEVSIAYILEGNKRVEISGFISGPVV